MLASTIARTHLSSAHNLVTRGVDPSLTRPRALRPLSRAHKFARETTASSETYNLNLANENQALWRGDYKTTALKPELVSVSRHCQLSQSLFTDVHDCTQTH